MKRMTECEVSELEDKIDNIIYYLKKAKAYVKNPDLVRGSQKVIDMVDEAGDAVWQYVSRHSYICPHCLEPLSEVEIEDEREEVVGGIEGYRTVTCTDYVCRKCDYWEFGSR